MTAYFWVGGSAAWDSSSSRWSLTSGGAPGAGPPTATDDVHFDANSGAVTVSFSALRSFANIDCSGFAGSFSSSSGGWSVGGSMTLSATTNVSAFTSGISFVSTASGNTITTAGHALASNVIFNGAGGGWTLQDAFTTIGTVTLTTGSLSTNGQAVTCSVFSSSNTNTRSLDMTNSTVTVNGNGTVWQCTSSTGMTLTSTNSTLVIPDSSGSTKVIDLDVLTYHAINFSGSGGFTINGSATLTGNLTVGSATALDTSSLTLTGVDFSSFTGVWTSRSGPAPLSLSGDFVLSAGMTIVNLTNLTLNGSGPQNLNTAGVTLPGNLTIACTGTVTQTGVVMLATGATFALTSGTYSSNGFAMDVGLVSLSGTTTRSLLMGSSVWTLSPGESGTTTPWDASTTTNLTFDAGSSSIVMANATISKIFQGGSLTYHDVSITGTAGALTIHGSNGFHSLSVSASHPVVFDASSTTTFTGQCAIAGASGNLTTIRSSSSGTQFTFTSSADQKSMDYVDVKDCIASLSPRWFAGRHSANSGNNKGWRFLDWGARSGICGVLAA